MWRWWQWQNEYFHFKDLLTLIVFQLILATITVKILKQGPGLLKKQVIVNMFFKKSGEIC